MGNLKFDDDWVRTTDLWCRKWPFYQLRHNHCRQWHNVTPVSAATCPPLSTKMYLVASVVQRSSWLYLNTGTRWRKWWWVIRCSIVLSSTVLLKSMIKGDLSQVLGPSDNEIYHKVFSTSTWQFNKSCRWRDSNPSPLVMEATARSTIPLHCP